MKHIVVSALLVAALAACGTPTPTYAPPTPVPPKAAPISNPPPTCMSWQNARAYMNQNQCIQGVVYSTYQDTKSAAFFINYDNSSTSFYVVSFKWHWDGLQGRCIQVTGPIQLYNGRPQIIIENTAQLNPCQ
jgi:predicted small lipoprotein YifL